MDVLCEVKQATVDGTVISKAKDNLNYDLLKAWLEDVCSRIAIKFGLVTNNGKPRMAFVLDTLLKYPCRGCIRKVLLNPNANGKVDAFFVQNHDLAVGLLVEGLRQNLEANGFKLKVEQETSSMYGKPDIIVKPTRTGVLVEVADLEIVIEVKTGVGFSYAQLIRYLVEKPNAIGIIWRILPNQILILDSQKHRLLLMLCLEAALKRGLDTLNGAVEECEHNPIRDFKIEIEDAQRLFDQYLTALTKSLPKIVGTVYEIIQSRHASKADLQNGTQSQALPETYA
ncbi:MAG: hypothetical protein QW222_06845 [Candidatus Bathyarchaeia archaeon]